MIVDSFDAVPEGQWLNDQVVPLSSSPAGTFGDRRAEFSSVSEVSGHFFCQHSLVQCHREDMLLSAATFHILPTSPMSVALCCKTGALGFSTL